MNNNRGGCFKRSFLAEKTRPFLTRAHGKPTRRRFFILVVVGQPAHVGTVGAHNIYFAVRLRVIRVQRRLILEPAAGAGEGYPLAIGRPGAVRVVIGLVACQTARSVPWSHSAAQTNAWRSPQDSLPSCPPRESRAGHCH